MLNNLYKTIKPDRKLNEIILNPDQIKQLNELKELLLLQDKQQLSLFLQKENIVQDDLYQTLNDDCWQYYQLIQGSMSTSKLIVCFTFIYDPARDPEHFAYKDAKDLLEKQKNTVINVSIHKSQLTKEHLKSMVIFANLLHMDFYMSNAQFKSFRRTSANLFSIKTITIDLDTYKAEDKNGNHPYDDEEQDDFYCNESTFEMTEVDKKLLYRINPILKKLGINYHMFVNSGHGRYLVFLLDRNINLSIPEMKLLYTTTLKTLIERLKHYEADAHCSDIGHLYRVPGNINPKTGRMSYVTRVQDETISLSELADKFGIHKKSETNKTLKLNTKRSFTISQSQVKSKYTNVNKQRNNDFQRLIELRNNDIKGYRNKIFHLMSINCFYMGMSKKQITYYLNNINMQLKEPYEDLETVIKYAEDNYNKYLIEPTKAVKYTNKEMVRMLKVTKQEQKEMQQLISRKEAKNRHDDFVKSNNEKIVQQNNQKKKELLLDMQELRYKKLMTNKEISVQLDVDERTVTKLIGKAPKFVTIGRMTTKEAVNYYVQLGYSNIEISNLLDINLRNIKRIKNKN